MGGRSVARRLAAILSADVEGYSRLMGDDEVATVRAITESRVLIASVTEERKRPRATGQGRRRPADPGRSRLGRLALAHARIGRASLAGSAVRGGAALREPELGPGARATPRRGVSSICG